MGVCRLVFVVVVLFVCLFLVVFSCVSQRDQLSANCSFSSVDFSLRYINENFMKLIF